MLRRLSGGDWRAVSAALLAAMLVGGGAAVAADQINSSEIANHAVKRVDIAKGVNKRIALGIRRPKFTAATPVAPGKTVQGVIGADFHSSTTTGSDFAVDETLPAPAPHGIGDDDVFINPDAVPGLTSTDTSALCTGSPSNPTAPAGTVCIYVAQADCAIDVQGFSVMPGTGESPLGFKVHWDCSAADANSHLDATYAYTAP